MPLNVASSAPSGSRISGPKLTLPLTLLTFGLFVLVINALMILLVLMVAGPPPARAGLLLGR